MKIQLTSKDMRDMVRAAINEISAADAYTRFYSDGGRYIHKDLYDELMGGTATMTPFHKFLIDLFLKGNASADDLRFGGDLFRNGSQEVRQYLVRAVQGDGDAIELLGVGNFMRTVASMKSHTEKQFNSRGFEVLYEDDGLLVTCTKTYTASRANYGDSHWCTASDLFGRYNGFEMFRRYTAGGDILVQFVDKGDRGLSYQVAYRTVPLVSEVEIYDWDDDQRNVPSLTMMVNHASMMDAPNPYEVIKNQYIKPNAARLSSETAEGREDESEYYRRKWRIKIGSILNNLKRDFNGKEMENNVLSALQNPSQDGGQFNFGNYSAEVVGVPDDARGGESYIVVVFYNGKGSIGDYINYQATEVENPIWVMATAKTWFITKDFKVVKKCDGGYYFHAQNLAVVSRGNDMEVYDIRNGNLLCNEVVDVHYPRQDHALVVYKSDGTGHIFNSLTGEVIR